MRDWLALSGLAVVTACAPAPDSDPRATTSHSIIGGTASTPEQDATVLVNEAGVPEGCTGTLIAPNLVLTARHCVTDFDPRDECGVPLGRDLPASIFSVSIGVYASPKQVVARGVKLWVPVAEDGFCGADLALIFLDKDIPNARTAKVRFTPPAPQETATAVGYGEGHGRRQRSVSVIAIGPSDATYSTRDGRRIPMYLPRNDFATSESTCYGDSGGPLLDADGFVMAVASRGIDDWCEDRPTIWTSLAAHQQLILDAAEAAGHPLDPEETAPAASRSGTVDGPDDPADPDEEDDADAPGGRSKRAPTESPSVASMGCAAGAPASSAPRTWHLLALATALAATARRRGPRARRR